MIYDGQPVPDSVEAEGSSSGRKLLRQSNAAKPSTSTVEADCSDSQCGQVRGQCSDVVSDAMMENDAVGDVAEGGVEAVVGMMLLTRRRLVQALSVSVHGEGSIL